MQPRLIPANLKKAREALGITRIEASNRMNIPQSSYVRYENGTRKPTYATIIQMAQVLGTSADFLTGKTKDETADSTIVKKESNPVLFEMVDGAKNFDEQQLARLYKYYKEISKSKK